MVPEREGSSPFFFVGFFFFLGLLFLLRFFFCLKQVADANLIAKWKKAGYEKLCCLRCIQPKDTNYGTTCYCRVPRKDIDQVVECVSCGCHGCASDS